jgi:heat-inducible transcriptional repressor
MKQAQQDAESELDTITAKLVSAGLAVWGGADETRQLIIRGQAHLLDDLTAAEDLERVRLLFADIETKRELIDLIGRAETGDGVRIYIGSENKLFSLSGSSVIAAPFRDSAQKIIGVLGVIGPTRLNYARIVPMVDFTAKVISSMLTKTNR